MVKADHQPETIPPAIISATDKVAEDNDRIYIFITSRGR